jgi:hypothetical protein
MAASTTISALRETSQKGCVPCHVFFSAIQRLMKAEASDSLDQNSRVILKFNMDTMGDSLALVVLRPHLNISFYARQRWYSPLPAIHMFYTVVEDS